MAVPTVIVPAEMSSDGTEHTYTGDADPVSGITGGMHTVNLLPLFIDAVSVAKKVVTATISALGGATTNSTSTTSLVIGTGSKALTLAETGKAYVVGQYVMIASTANPANSMIGQVTAFSGTSLTVNVVQANGSGTFAAWTNSVTAKPADKSGIVTSNITTSAIDLTLTNASSGFQSVTMSALGKSITLPNATTCSVQSPLYAIKNDGFYPIGVRDASGVLLKAIPAGKTAYVNLLDNSTSAGVWDVLGDDLEAGMVTIDYQFSSTVVTFYDNSCALDDNKSIHFYRGASNELYAFAVDNTTKAIGTSVLVKTATAYLRAVFKITSTTAIAFYDDNSANSYAVVISLSGSTTLSVGTPASVAALYWASESFFSAPKITQLTATSYVACYGSDSVVAISVSGTTVTIGTQVTVGTANSGARIIYTLTSTTALFLYIAGAAAPYSIYATVVTVSGATCTLGTQVAISTSHSYVSGDSICACLLSPTKALILDDNNGTSVVRATAITISGTTVTAGTVFTVFSGSFGAGAVTYTANSATRYNAHLTPLTSNTALCWILDTTGTNSHSIVLSESSGTLTKGNELYQSFSAAASGSNLSGLVMSIGAASFLAVQEIGTTYTFSPWVIPHKINGVTITTGAKKLLSCTPTTNTAVANIGGTKMPNNDFVFTHGGLFGATTSLEVISSNGDFIRAKGIISVPFAAGGFKKDVSQTRIIIMNLSTYDGSAGNYLRLINVEIAK